jgi:hypothetical protein
MFSFTHPQSGVLLAYFFSLGRESLRASPTTGR